ncbi:dihydrofolate reductase [Starmerella bacillaris]|uniref:Dihydrofolate reductase n=1 Tax=Starmerella bacillaris TaxID=1247836 RepID=A0AAV5RML5_STABA|nr:dihydrofolate reductase [Starmerella bacillaris]
MTQSRSVSLILAATDPAFGIGRKGQLPWHLKGEMKYFKQVTTDSTVIMGRKTWYSIPVEYRPLVNRKNVVISRDPSACYGTGVLACTSVESALGQCDKNKSIFVIGGAEIYKACLPYADKMFITLIKDESNKIKCDTFFRFNQNEWQMQPSERLKEALGKDVDIPDNCSVTEDGLEYTFTLWERRNV